MSSRRAPLQPPDLGSLFDQSPVQAVVLDPSLRVVAVTDRYLAVTAQRRDALLGENLWDAMPDAPGASPEVTANLRASAKKAFATGASDAMAVVQYSIPQPEGLGGGHTTRYWSIVNVPFFGARGRVSHVYHCAEDVTEFVQLRESDSGHSQRSAQLEALTEKMRRDILQRSHELETINTRLRDVNRDLGAANDAKSEFLSRVSHELRTPLTAILGFTELLSLTAPDAESDRQRFSAAILKAGDHLLELINGVLDISRIEGGHLSLSPTPVNVSALLADTVELIRPVADAHRVRLISDIAPVAATYVLADPHRLKQVYINLLSNAVKFNHEGGEVRIAGTTRRDDAVRISISDTGWGLSADSIARLFVPFERLDAAARHVEGTGLGLTLSRTLTEAMGGTLDVSSEVGKGSDFSVVFPMCQPSALNAQESAEDRENPSRVYATTHCVLYIEDVVANVSLIEEVMKRRPGTRLISAMLGSTGLDLAREHRPDLILLDLHLPDMDGAEVLRRLRAEPVTRSIPVMVLSADATGRQAQELVNAGAVRYLTKPVRIKQLLHAFDTELGE